MHVFTVFKMIPLNPKQPVVFSLQKGVLGRPGKAPVLPSSRLFPRRPGI